MIWSQKLNNYVSEKKYCTIKRKKIGNNDFSHVICALRTKSREFSFKALFWGNSQNYFYFAIFRGQNKIKVNTYK